MALAPSSPISLLPIHNSLRLEHLLRLPIIATAPSLRILLSDKNIASRLVQKQRAPANTAAYSASSLLQLISNFFHIIIVSALHVDMVQLFYYTEDSDNGCEYWLLNILSTPSVGVWASI